MAINYEYHRDRILQALVEHGEMIKTALREKSCRHVPAAVTDQWLEGMVKQGLITHKVRRTNMVGGGRPGAFYRITEAGRRMAND